MVSTDSKSEIVTKNQDTSSYDGDYDQINNEFKNELNPAVINNACTSWGNAASALGSIADAIRSQAATPLEAAWNSKTSPDAQLQLQYAQATAQALADHCIQMAHANDWAYQYAQWYKDHTPGTGLFKTGSDGTAMAEHLTALLSRYNEVIVNCVPSEVQSNLVRNSTSSNIDTFTKTPGPGPVGPGATPNGPGPGPSPVPTPSPTPTLTPGPTPTPTANPWTTATPTPTPTPTPIPTTNGPGPIDTWTPYGPGPGGIDSGSLGTDAFGSPGIDSGSSLAGLDAGGGAGGAFGGGGAGVGDGLGSPGGAGSGLAGGGGLGSAGGGAGIGAAGGAGSGAGSGAGGRGFLPPMHGGGGGNGDEERERSTWLVEDEDVWGASDAPPGVIS